MVFNMEWKSNNLCLEYFLIGLPSDNSSILLTINQLLFMINRKKTYWLFVTFCRLWKKSAECDVKEFGSRTASCIQNPGGFQKIQWKKIKFVSVERLKTKNGSKKSDHEASVPQTSWSVALKWWKTNIPTASQILCRFEMLFHIRLKRLIKTIVINWLLKESSTNFAIDESLTGVHRFKEIEQQHIQSRN